MRNLCGKALLASISVCFSALTVHGEPEQLDVKMLARKARPAVMLVIVSDEQGKEIATGTGFLVSQDGKLITNYHVVAKAAKVIAKAENGGQFQIRGVLAEDPANDLVVVKLDGDGLPFLKFAMTDRVEVGSRVVVVGSPLGLEGTLSEGIISAVRGEGEGQTLIQLTAAISPGSSGSPVLNAKGEVIGIASALLEGGQSLNFARSAAPARDLLAEATAATVVRPLVAPRAATKLTYVTDPDALASQRAIDAKDWPKLLTHAKALVGKYPDLVGPYLSLNIAYRNLTFTDEAINACKQAINIDPTCAACWGALGFNYSQSGRGADAVVAFRQAVNLSPDDGESWFALGFGYEREGKTGDAIVAYKKATVLDSGNPMSWASLGGAYKKDGRMEDAISAYRRAVELSPDHFLSWWALGLIYMELGRTAESEEAYRHAKRLAPESKQEHAQ